MRKSIAAVAAAAAAGLGLVAPAAANATPGGTAVTFTLTGGSLTLSQPGSATLTASPLAVTGSSVTGQLGSTTVTDARGALGHTDTVTMSSSDFSDGSGHTITAANASGYSGVATPTGGVGVPVPTLTGQSLDGAGSTILQITSVVGSAGATYNPTVSVTVPANAVAGTYTGTVTQTVS